MSIAQAPNRAGRKFKTFHFGLSVLSLVFATVGSTSCAQAGAPVSELIAAYNRSALPAAASDQSHRLVAASTQAHEPTTASDQSHRLVAASTQAHEPTTASDQSHRLVAAAAPAEYGQSRWELDQRTRAARQDGPRQAPRPTRPTQPTQATLPAQATLPTPDYSRDTVGHAHLPDVPVLCYHLNLPGSNRHQGYNVAPEDLRRQLQTLRDQGYRTIRLADFYQLIRGERVANLPGRPLLLTFDDGPASNLTVVEPILRSLDYSGVFFLYPSIIGSKKKRYLRWPQARELARSRHVEIGSHTYWHPKLPEMSRSEIRYQLEKSRRVLEERLQLPSRITALAYPFGLYDRRVIEEAKRAGYMMAFTINPSRVAGGDDPFTLNRYMVAGGHSLKTFLGYVERRSPRNMSAFPPDGSLISNGGTLRLQLPGVRPNSVRISINGRRQTIDQDRSGLFVGRANFASNRRYLIATVRAKDATGKTLTKRLLYQNADKARQSNASR